MKVINRKSKELVAFGGKARTRMYATFRQYCIFFTTTVAHVCEMQEGTFIHFMNEGASWNFIVNDDPDGFPLLYVPSKKTYIVSNAGVTNMIRKTMGFAINVNKRLAVEKTTAMHDKCPVFAFSTDTSNTMKK